MRCVASWLVTVLLVSAADAATAEEALVLSGQLSGEYRRFFDAGPRPELATDNLSSAGRLEIYQPLGDGRDSLRATVFGRVDEHDDERSHVDVRELKWHKVESDWELTIGVDQVFWGVTETVHLVNIINQTDLVESPDGEEFLGQPMARLGLIRDWGYLDLFVMPYFRERTYGGRDGRPGSGLLISNNDALYESGAEEQHIDTAIRWSNSVEAWDLGLSWFYGTSREPRFSDDAVNLNARAQPEYIPIYDLIHQGGVDVQGTFDAWLLKLEAIYRDGRGGDFFAGAAGFEYTFFDIGRSGMDVGLISEYLYDERDEQVATGNDVSMGLRLTLNDINSTQFLAAFVQDIEADSGFYYIEASRRIGDDFTLSLEARGVKNVEAYDSLEIIEQDDFLQLEFSYHF